MAPKPLLDEARPFKPIKSDRYRTEPLEFCETCVRSSIGSSIRLLSEGLWVRVPPDALFSSTFNKKLR